LLQLSLSVAMKLATPISVRRWSRPPSSASIGPPLSPKHALCLPTQNWPERLIEKIGPVFVCRRREAEPFVVVLPQPKIRVLVTGHWLANTSHWYAGLAQRLSPSVTLLGMPIRAGAMLESVWRCSNATSFLSPASPPQL
jgi:hypothetical protein